jgi:hypothetical protein
MVEGCEFVGEDYEGCGKEEIEYKGAAVWKISSFQGVLHKHDTVTAGNHASLREFFHPRPKPLRPLPKLCPFLLYLIDQKQKEWSHKKDD